MEKSNNASCGREIKCVWSVLRYITPMPVTQKVRRLLPKRRLRAAHEKEKKAAMKPSIRAGLIPIVLNAGTKWPN